MSLSKKSPPLSLLVPTIHGIPVLKSPLPSKLTIPSASPEAPERQGRQPANRGVKLNDPLITPHTTHIPPYTHTSTGTNTITGNLDTKKGGELNLVPFLFCFVLIYQLSSIRERNSGKVSSKNPSPSFPIFFYPSSLQSESSVRNVKIPFRLGQGFHAHSTLDPSPPCQTLKKIVY